MAKGNKNNFNVVKGKAPQRTAKGPQKPQKPMNPQMTIEVKNDKLIEAMSLYKTAAIPENLVKMLEVLKDARVLVPAAMRQIKDKEGNDKMLPVPAIFSNEKGERFLWAITDREHIPTDQPKIGGYMNMAFLDLVNLALQPVDNIRGISINPKGDGIVLTQLALQALKDGKLPPIQAPGTKPADPQMTIEVKNEDLETALMVYKGENNAKNLVELIKAAAPARILTPVIMRDVEGKKLPAPVLLNDKEGRQMIPIYTAKEFIPKDLKTGIINLPLVEVMKASVKETEGNEKFYGVVFNPTEMGIRFSPKLIKAIAENPEDTDEAIKALLENPQPKQIKLTEKQYLAFEHVQFENAFLPAELFTDGQAVIDRLCTEKEEYIDQLFEESYKEKLMYPYLPEDFSVMALNVAEGMDVVRVDFPAQDQGVGSCARAYLTWEKATQTPHYFGIVNQANKTQTLVEITMDGKRVDHGVCPTEGTELNKIIELANAGKEE